MNIQPQSRKQEMFLECGADIVIFGGAAGSSKTFSLLMECVRHVDNSLFSFVVFRRTSPQIRKPGGLWDTSEEVFPHLKAEPAPSVLTWRFPSGAKGVFSHMVRAKDRFDWDGTQIPLICFDELQHFERSQFEYMLSRNRSTCGVRPYMRATCNPDPTSWLAEFLAWWIDQDEEINGVRNVNYGYPIEERCGVIRWFIRFKDELIWGDTREDLIRQYAIGKWKERVDDPANPVKPTSVTFISAKLDDNPMLERKDPGYRGRLHALPYIERMRLLHGNWKVTEAAGMYFKREWWIIENHMPPIMYVIRYWDLAGTPGTMEQERDIHSPEKRGPSRTSGLKMAVVRDGLDYAFIIMHVIALRATPGKVMDMVYNITVQDNAEMHCPVVLEKDPGQAGKFQVQEYVKKLQDYEVKANLVREPKGKRSLPLSAQVEYGRCRLLFGTWNGDFITESENFDGGIKYHADRIDCAGGAYIVLKRWLAQHVGQDIGGPVGIPAFREVNQNVI